MHRDLRIFQLNVRKRDTVQLGVMNDADLSDYAVLSLTEPYARLIDGAVVTAPMSHSKWTKMVPSVANPVGWPIRSMLWVRRDLESEQVAVSSPDLTAAVLRLQGRQVLVVSVYVQCNGASALLAAVREVNNLISRFRSGTGERTDVVVAGDFNRHDVLWGGEGTITRRQGEGQPIRGTAGKDTRVRHGTVGEPDPRRVRFGPRRSSGGCKRGPRLGDLNELFGEGRNGWYGGLRGVCDGKGQERYVGSVLGHARPT